MSTNDPVVNSLLNRLTEARARRLELDIERNELTSDIGSLEHVASMYSGQEIATPTASTTSQQDPMGLANLTLRAGLEKIAEANNNVLVAVDAKRQLLVSGKIKSAKNASSQIYTHLTSEHVRTEYDKAHPRA